MRCFIALDLPGDAKGVLASASRNLSDRFPGARWMRPDSFHITLAFLGDISGTALDCAGKAVEAAEGLGAFDLGFSGLVCLPERGSARVLALGAGQGASECRAVYDRVNCALSEEARVRDIGPLNPEWPDGRPFRVHVTLARAGSRPLPRDSDAAWEEFGQNLQAPCRISRCILYRSDLSPDGARYEAVHTVNL